MVMETIPTAVRDIVEDVAQLLISPAAAKQISLQVFVSPELPTWILLDPLRLRQILLNLLGNALKFTASDAERQGLVTLKVEPAVLRDGRRGICFRIKDNGIGMSADTIRSLFQPFTQADETTTRRFGGTGLGLSITLRLVQLLDGMIFVRSRLGEGSEFWFELPLNVAETGQQRLPEPDLSEIRVIIVTSQPFYAEILPAYLRAAGAELTLVANTTDLDTARQAFPAAQVLLLDPSFAKQTIRLDQPEGNAPLCVVQLTTRSHTSSNLVGKIMAPSEPLLYLDLLQAVAVAAGRFIETRQKINHTNISGRVAPSVEEACSNGQLILLAEDNEINRTVIQEQLRILGYASEVAEDGLQALVCWRSGRYALILTDFHMPNMDGYQLTAAIRAEEGEGRRLPIIAITADALQGEAERCIESGMSAYLSKPLRLTELAAMLDIWLPHADSPQEPVQLEPVFIETSVTEPQTLVWDEQVLPALMGSELVQHRPLLEKFVQRAAMMVAELNEAIDSGDMRRVADIAHTLKILETER